MEIHLLKPEKLSLKKVTELLTGHLKLSKEAIEIINNSNHYLNKRVAEKEEAIYGVNTGFGSLCDTIISKADLGVLQENLVKSHACGLGEFVPVEIVKVMLLLKIQNMLYGYSGVKLETVQRYIDFYNNNLFPVIYQQGSLGASGDLAPLAHLALPLIGDGEFWMEGQRISTEKVYEKMGWKPLQLGPKEGLALLNGTQFMSAYAVYLLVKAEKLFDWSLTIAAMSFDGFDARTEPYFAGIHQIRPHKGQIYVANRMNELLKDSEIAAQEKKHVQDPYSFRCIPQVMGASLDWLNFIKQTVETEISSVTDNPTVFIEDDLIVSAGNFHGQPLALGLDAFAIAIAEMASISERRIYKLISGTRGLPAFLTPSPGLHSGFMIPQYTAASIVSQNKQLCTPASVDTIDSSNGQEDHVSMGANAATKAFKVLENLQKVLAIELMCACQALDFRKPLKTSTELEKIKAEYRKHITFLEKDAYMAELMEKSIRFLD